jgi:hypothetical protein
MKCRALLICLSLILIQPGVSRACPFARIFCRHVTPTCQPAKCGSEASCGCEACSSPTAKEAPGEITSLNGRVGDLETEVKTLKAQVKSLEMRQK